jgi:hypothetical protein
MWQEADPAAERPTGHVEVRAPALTSCERCVPPHPLLRGVLVVGEVIATSGVACGDGDVGHYGGDIAGVLDDLKAHRGEQEGALQWQLTRQEATR